VSGRRSHDERAVGQLLLAPAADTAIERFQEMVAAIKRRTLRFKPRSPSSRLVIRHWDTANAKAGHSQDRPSYCGWIVEHWIVPDAASEARSETLPMNTTPTTHAGQLALALAHPKHRVRDRARTTEAAEAYRPNRHSCFEQLRFQSGKATGRALLREPFSVSVGKALAPVR
jgi:hypothetical protein